MKLGATFIGVFVFGCLTAVGCGGGGGGVNRGSQCRQVLVVTCDKLGNLCAAFPVNQIDACVTSGVMTCCAGNCGAGVVSTQADIDACITDVNAASCTALDVTHGGSLPPSCVGVVRSSLSASRDATTSALRASEASPGARVGELVGR